MSRGIATTAATKTYSTLNPSVTMYLFWSPRGTIGSESRDLYALWSVCAVVVVN